MSTCEKCWADADNDSEQYSRLIVQRNRVGKPPMCTPEDQAGPGATECPECHRLTLHQHTGEPMCGCSLDPTPWCSGCGAMKRKNCDCGPIAAND